MAKASVLSGWAAVESIRKEQAEKKAAFESGKFKTRAFPLILKENSDKYPDNADVTFIDDSPVILPLVTYQARDGKWVTRRHQGVKDPINKVKGVKPRQTCLFTVIDHTPRSYTNQEGALVELPYTIRYLPLSVNQSTSLSDTMRRSKKQLKNALVNVSKTGTALAFLPIEFDEAVHLFPEEEVDSFDFEEVFPLDVDGDDAGVQPERVEAVKY